MDTPPPYRAKKSNTGLIIGLIIGAVVLCCVGPILLLGGGGLWAWNMAKEPLNCSLTLGLLQKATLEYAAANDGKLPSAENWENEIRPFYEKSFASFTKEKMPFSPASPTGPWGCSAEDGVKTSLTFNSALSAQLLTEAQKDPEAVLIYEAPTEMPGHAAPYDAAKLGPPPKRMANRMWFRAPLSGKVEAIDAKGKTVDIDMDVDANTR